VRHNTVKQEEGTST